MSRKPIAKEFKGWVFEVIKEIRLTGEYKLNKENEELKKQLEEKDKETNTLIYQNQLVNHNKFLQLRDKDIPLFKKVEPNNFVLLQLLNSNTYSLVFSP